MKYKLKSAAGVIILSASLSALLLANDSSTNDNSSIQVYGAGDKIDDKSYRGAGIKYENDFLKAIIEYGDDYKKASGIYKYDINNDIYTKFGLGYLEREILISTTEKDVDQKTGGVAIGYGDNKMYNVEVGHIIAKLDGANDADGYSRISYVEALGKYDLGDMGSIDSTGVYKNTRVYSKNYSDYSLEVGYYPINDIKISSKYDSIDQDNDNYSVKAGIEYIFGTNEIKPYLTASRQSSENLSFSLTYENDIVNKALNMRDEFENTIGTSQIIAQSVAPNEFDAKQCAVTLTNDTYEFTSISNEMGSYTICRLKAYVNCNGIIQSLDLSESYVNDLSDLLQDTDFAGQNISNFTNTGSSTACNGYGGFD